MKTPMGILLGVLTTKKGQIVASTTVKVDAETYAKLRETATETSQPMIVVLAKAVETYRRQIFLEALNSDFAALRTETEAWKEELAERAAWDNALADDLENN
jgi:predicted transcriptional regulator